MSKSADASFTAVLLKLTNSRRASLGEQSQEHLSDRAIQWCRNALIFAVPANQCRFAAVLVLRVIDVSFGPQNRQRDLRLVAQIGRVDIEVVRPQAEPVRTAELPAFVNSHERLEGLGPVIVAMFRCRWTAVQLVG